MQAISLSLKTEAGLSSDALVIAFHATSCINLEVHRRQRRSDNEISALFLFLKQTVIK